MEAVIETFEQHYTPKQVAARLGLTAACVRSMFRSDPSVLKLTTGTKRGSRGYKRGRVTLRIPQSAVVRKMKELSKQ